MAFELVDGGGGIVERAAGQTDDMCVKKGMPAALTGLGRVILPAYSGFQISHQDWGRSFSSAVLYSNAERIETGAQRVDLAVLVLVDRLIDEPGDIRHLGADRSVATTPSAAASSEMPPSIQAMSIEGLPFCCFSLL